MIGDMCYEENIKEGEEIKVARSLGLRRRDLETSPGVLELGVQESVTELA